MKKIFFFFIMFFIAFNVDANELKEVKLSKCIDGDTAVFIVNDEEVKVRFLAIDTPETKHPTIGSEEGGMEASEYTCELLKKAKKIELLYDPKVTDKDKYGRTLAWIYIDGELIQKKLVSLGLAEVSYIYKKYLYVDELCELQSEAINKNYGIWASGERIEGYCKTKSNTKKTTTTKIITEDQKIKSAIKYFIDGKYDKGIDVILDSTSCIPILFIILIIVLFIKLFNKKRKK